MELSNNITKPKVVTTLEISHAELVEAIVEYAEKRGYKFSDGDWSIFYPSDHPAGKRTIELIIANDDGVEPPITK